MPLDQIAADRRHPEQGPLLRGVARRWPTGPQVGEELGPGVLSGSEKDRVRVHLRFLWQGGDVKTAEHDTDASCAVSIGDLVGATGGRDVHLDHDEVRLVVERDLLDMLVPDRDVIVSRQVASERRQTERGKERVLDRPEEWTRRLGERREDHLDAHVNRPPNPAPGCNGRRSRRLRARGGPA